MRLYSPYMQGIICGFYRQPICLPDLQGDILQKNLLLWVVYRKTENWKNGRAFTSCSQKNIADMWEETVMTGEQGRISVIVPVYNCEQYLEKLWKACACRNTETGSFIWWSVIPKIKVGNFPGLCRKHENIYMLYNGCEGIGSARNLGLQAAKGEYILFLDPDDYLPDELVLIDYCQTDTDILISYDRLLKSDGYRYSGTTVILYV